MPKFEIRCNTERVLEVEADDEASAVQIAEQTDFSDWDSAESPYSIERMMDASATPNNTAPHHVQTVECGTDTLRIDVELFRVQRELLTKIADLARKNRPYTPASGDDRLLNGLLELTDALLDATETSEGTEEKD
jgi:hypothetical protein